MPLPTQITLCLAVGKNFDEYSARKVQLPLSNCCVYAQPLWERGPGGEGPPPAYPYPIYTLAQNHHTLRNPRAFDSIRSSFNRGREH